MRQTMENPWYREENDLQMVVFPLFLFAGGGYVGISLVAKMLNFCPNCGIHDNAKAAQPESADAACFPLTSQHSSVQTQ